MCPIKKQTVPLSVFFICCLALAPFGLAQVPPGPPGEFMFQGAMPGPGFGGPMGRRGFRDMEGGRIFELLQRPDVQKELGITEEQRNKLEDIAFNARKAAIQARSNLEVYRLELTRLMRADNPDRSAIDKKLQEVAQAEAALRRSMINSFLDTRNVLTKEQRDKVREGMQKLIRERTQRMQQRGPGYGRFEWRGRRGQGNEGREGAAPPPPPPRPPIQ